MAKTIVLDSFGRHDSAGKTIDDFKLEPIWNCRFHPTDWWHETGCPHRDWSNEELHHALVVAKQSLAWQLHLLSFPEDGFLQPKPKPPRRAR